MKRIERSGHLEVLLAEIETYRDQGESMGVELFREFEREARKQLRWRVFVLCAGAAAFMAYCTVIWYGVLKAIGAL